VLLAILTTIIGFSIGNVYGQQKMKMILSDLITKMTDGLKTISTQDKKGENGPK
jgi:hypothetical protein